MITATSFIQRWRSSGDQFDVDAVYHISIPTGCRILANHSELGFAVPRNGEFDSRNRCEGMRRTGLDATGDHDKSRLGVGKKMNTIVARS